MSASILGISTMCNGVRQGFDYLVKFNDGARPSVRDDQGHGAGFCAFGMNEMYGKVVDDCSEVVKTIQLFLSGGPVVFFAPVATKLLGILQRNTLAPVVRRFRIWPPGRVQTVLQFGDVSCWNVYDKWLYVRHLGIARVTLTIS